MQTKYQKFAKLFFILKKLAQSKKKHYLCRLFPNEQRLRHSFDETK